MSRAAAAPPAASATHVPADTNEQRPSGGGGGEPAPPARPEWMTPSLVCLKPPLRNCALASPCAGIHLPHVPTQSLLYMQSFFGELTNWTCSGQCALATWAPCGQALGAVRGILDGDVSCAGATCIDTSSSLLHSQCMGMSWAPPAIVSSRFTVAANVCRGPGLWSLWRVWRWNVEAVEGPKALSDVCSGEVLFQYRSSVYTPRR